MHKNPVVKYYHSFESKLGYRFLGGVKHFGYYPVGQENLPTIKAQELMNEQLAQTLALPAGSKILDAGCGEGGVSLYLAKHYGMRMTGIDLLDFNIAKAKRIARQEGLANMCEFDEASYLDTSFPDASFDAIYTMETLVHSPDYEKTLVEFHRLLKPGGKYVAFEYSLAPRDEMPSKADRAFERVNKLAAMPAFNEFRYGVLERALSDRGFVKVKSQDITERMLPLLRKFEKKAKHPYRLVSSMGLQNHFVNAMSAVVFSKYMGFWKYNIISGTKSG